MFLILKYLILIVFFSINYSSSNDDPFGMLEYYDTCRLKAFNTTPDSENKIDEDWWGLIDKNDVILEYTTEIDESFIDDSESLTDYAKAQKADLLLKTIVGSVLTNKIHFFDKDEIPSNPLDPLFSYYTVIDQATDLSRDLLAKIRANGYALIDATDLDHYGNKYNNLFTYSGVTPCVFACWFNKVFKAHEPGFVMQNPGLSIKSYDPSEQFIRPGTRLRFDPRCSDPKLCDHTDVFEILDEEIEACYNKRPDVPFRYFKPKSPTIGNTRGGSNGTLGRKFGNPDVADLSLAKKEVIEGSMRDYLDVRRLLSPLYLEVKRRSYLEVDSDDEVSELSERAVLALDTMARNADSERL